MNKKLSIRYCQVKKENYRTECKYITSLVKKSMLCIEKGLECFIPNLTLDTLENRMEGKEQRYFSFSLYTIRYGLIF